MSDLISRKELFERVLREEYDNDIHTDGRAKAIHHGEYQHFYKVISEMPTAFDLESVIKQLNENKEDVLKAIKENSKSEYEMIKIKDLKELFEEYTQEQIDIIKSNIKGV